MKNEKEKEAAKPEQKGKVNLAYQRDKDKEKVRGIFKNYEVPGGIFRFSYGPIYKGDQTENFELEDGKIYTLPLGVAKHLNKNCWYPEHSYVMDQDGKPIAKVGTKHRRVGFQSLEFVDIDDLTPTGQPLVTVEHAGVV